MMPNNLPELLAISFGCALYGGFLIGLLLMEMRAKKLKRHRRALREENEVLRGILETSGYWTRNLSTTPPDFEGPDRSDI